MKATACKAVRCSRFSMTRNLAPRTDQATAALNAAEKEVSAADSDLALAEATLKRYQQLYEKKSVSPQEFDEIKARYQSAEARRDMARAGQAQANAALTQARTSLGYTRIHAPFAGVVTEKKADAGTLASPGMPMFTIEDTRSYRLEVTVDESELRLVRVGQVSPVTIDALGNVQLSGKVVQIVPAADPASRSFLVKVELPADARLRSGLFGRARFSRGERTALLIPRTSLVERGQLQGVYVLDANQIAGLRYVTLGKSAGEQIEVLSGLQDGEKLVAVAGRPRLGRQTNRNTAMSDTSPKPGNSTHVLRLAGQHCAPFHSVEADTSVHRRRSPSGDFQHPADAARGRTADCRPHAGRLRPDARGVGRRSNATRHRAHGKAAP